MRQTKKEKAAKSHARYAANKEEYKSRIKAWRAANPQRHKAALKAWNNKNPEKYKKITRRARLRREYNLSLEQYETMAVAQDGRCAICRCKPKKALHVDHNHDTGEVRALLCNRCNIHVGFRESPLFLAVCLYLRKHGK